MDSISHIPDIYNLDNLDNYENNKKNNFIMNIEKEYNDYVKKFIFIANNKKIYQCKCLFYSGNIIDIDLSNYIIIRDGIVYVSTFYLMSDGIHCFSHLIKYNYDDNYNIFKLYDDSIEYLRRGKDSLTDNIYNIINKHKVELKETYLYVDPNNNIDDTICEFIFIKTIRYLSLGYNNLYRNKYIEFCQNLINIIDDIEIKNIIHITGYVYIDSKDIIGCVDQIINKTKKRHYKVENIIFEYFYDIHNKYLYLLLKKCGDFTFNEHIKCKTCVKLRKNINIDFDIKILENLILCYHHYITYKNKFKKCFNMIKILKNIIIEQIN